MATIENHIEWGQDDIEKAIRQLRCALHCASPVEALVLTPIIGQIADARNKVAALIEARKAKS